MPRPKTFDVEAAQIRALRLFWRKGYAATSIEDLTEALSLSRSSLYDTFGDKRTLFLTVLKRYSDRVLAKLANTLETAPSVFKAVETLLDELAAEVSTPSSALGCFMVNSVAELVPYDPDVTQLAEAYSTTFQRLLAEALHRAAAAGTWQSEQTPEQTAVYLFNTIQGLRVLIKSGATAEQVTAIKVISLRALA